MMCKIGTLLEKVSSNERELLSTALIAKDERGYTFSAKELSCRLNSVDEADDPDILPYFSIGATTIKDHRNSRCKCGG